VERVNRAGIAIVGSDAVIESTAIRDVGAEPSSGIFGRGISIEPDASTGERSNVTLRNCLVERTHEAGIAILGSDADVRSCAILDTRPRPGDAQFGRGFLIQESIEARLPANVKIAWSVVDQSHNVGISVVSAQLVLEHSVVSNTLPTFELLDFGDGVASQSLYGFNFETKVSIDSSIVEQSARAGLAAFGADIDLSRSLLRCNAIQLNHERSAGTDGRIMDGGGNTCSCDGVTTPCKALSSELSPPEAL